MNPEIYAVEMGLVKPETENYTTVPAPRLLPDEVWIVKILLVSEKAHVRPPFKFYKF